MKNLLLSTALILFATACGSDDPKPAVDTMGSWKLIEQLADPGDGSGTFQPIESNKRLTFYENGMFYASGSLCQLDKEGEGLSTGTYDEDAKLLYPDDCEDFKLSYEIDGNHLILYFPCIEACAQKYEKSDMILCG